MAELISDQSSAAIDHLSRSFERLTQLLALLSSSPLAKSTTTAPAIVLVDKAMRCIASALSELQTSSRHRIDSPVPDEVSRIGSSPWKSRNKKKDSWTIVTSVPHFDGHQWRKYGQKRIHRSEFPRSYYKCTHCKDQGCQATKTIQQKEDEISHPPKYVVSYNMHHTCKAIETHDIPFVMDSSAIINKHSIPTSRATSPDLSPTLMPLQVANIDDMSLMESMLSSTVPYGEPLAAFDFDWDLQLS